MFERFTDRARRVVVLAQDEARTLHHNYIGTEHILLGLIHEGQGVAAKTLESLGISLEAVRQQVEEIIGQGQGPQHGQGPSDVPARVNALESRLSAIEQRVGTGPATGDLDEQIAQVRRDKESAIDSQDFEQAGSLRDRERRLLAGKTARQQQWEAAHPDLASLADQVQRLTGEVERLRDLLRHHGIEPEDNTA